MKLAYLVNCSKRFVNIYNVSSIGHFLWYRTIGIDIG